MTNTRYVATYCQFEYPLYGIRAITVDNSFFGRGRITVHNEDDQLTYWEDSALDSDDDYSDSPDALGVLEKQAQRNNKYTSRGTTVGYSQGDVLDFLLTSEYPITPEDVTMFERWIWGDSWLIDKQEEVTYTAEDGDTVTLWRNMEDHSTVEFADMWELEQRHPGIKIING